VWYGAVQSAEHRSGGAEARVGHVHRLAECGDIEDAGTAPDHRLGGELIGDLLLHWEGFR
jgi:hypothetical protein